MRLGFVIDQRSCVGCKACQIACKDRNGLEPGRLWRRVVEVAGGSWRQEAGVWVDGTLSYFLSLACMHCEAPICLEVCPTRAITQRPDGLVSIDAERCMGCGYCEWACPYRAPQYDSARGVMTKCDLCQELIDAGKSPACVAACPLRVLGFGDMDELRQQHGREDSIFPLPDRALTRPAVVLTPHRDADRVGREVPWVGNEEEI